MEYKRRESDKTSVTLSAKALAIVFKQRKWSESRATSARRRTTNNDVHSSQSEHNDGNIEPQELFKQFVKKNSCCYWDPHLEESVKNLKYEGHIQPNTLLVTGREIYVETIKGAWSRRAVQSPIGYSIRHVGDVMPIDIMLIPQTQFTPLPEALCIIIQNLTSAQKDASFDAILVCLKTTYQKMQQPTESIVYETLGGLIKDRKIYHTGSGYHILGPEFYQPGCNSIKLQDHHLVVAGGDAPIFIPLMNPNCNNNADMRSISCQTEKPESCPKSTKEVSTEKDNKSKRVMDGDDKDKRNKLDRSHSFRESKKDRKVSEVLMRGTSLQYEKEKLPGQFKDINLKTSDAHQDKSKGEKMTLLNKLFGRNKSPKDTGTEHEETKTTEVERVTFSAQFPPLDWSWYENHVQDLLENSHGYKMDHFLRSKQNEPDKMSADLHIPHASDHNDAAEGVYDEIHIHARNCPVTRAKLLPAELMAVPKTSSPIPHLSFTSHSGSWSSSTDITNKAGEARNQEYILKHKLQPSEYFPVSQKQDLTPDHRQSFYGDDTSWDEDRLRCLKPKFSGHGLGCDTGKQDDDQNPTAPYARQALNASESFVEESDSDSPKRPSHVSKVFRKYRRMKCPNNYENDISVVHCGKISRNQNPISKSRDSGVNCIGVKAITHDTQCDTRFEDVSYNDTQVNNHSEKSSRALPVSSHFHQAKSDTLPVPDTHPKGSANTSSDACDNTGIDNQVHPSTNIVRSGQRNSDYRLHSTVHRYPSQFQVSECLPEVQTENSAAEHRVSSMVSSWGQSEGSMTNVWSDTSQQTVREAQPIVPSASPIKNTMVYHSSSHRSRQAKDSPSPVTPMIRHTEHSTSFSKTKNTKNSHHSKPRDNKYSNNFEGHKSRSSHQKHSINKKKCSYMANSSFNPSATVPLSETHSESDVSRDIERCPVLSYPSKTILHNHFEQDSIDPENNISHERTDYNIVGVI